MKRDAQVTRQRILEAATVEFARYGIAGARIDRIAEAAGSNKSMIYAYFTSKDQLFDAVFDAIVVRTMSDVPIDAHDLPEYAARLFDQHQKYPEVLRIASWDQLERGAVGMNVPAVVEANELKIKEIVRAQQDGIITDHFAASTLLGLILAITQSRPNVADEVQSESDLRIRRQSIKDAVELLVRPRNLVDRASPVSTT
jgi:Transcriptional regulator